MNADATPEKRPACTSNQHGGRWGVKVKPHKDEGRIEVIIILFHKFLVMLLGVLVVCLVKVRAAFGILRDCQCRPNRRWKTHKGWRRVVAFTALFVIFLHYFDVARMVGRNRLASRAVYVPSGRFAKITSQ